MNPLPGFLYKSDGWIDSWHILPDYDLTGDCDDFAITVLDRETNGNAIQALKGRQAEIWLVRDAHGQKHVVLFLTGKGWSCCQYPHWYVECRFRKIMRFPVFLVQIKLALGRWLRQ